MSSVRDNKFLIGYAVVVAVASIALGVLLFLAYGHYAEISKTYDTQAAELQRLQALKPYPNLENLTALEARRDGYRGSIEDLRRALAAREIPLEEITPNQFQDRLRERVSAILPLAAESGVELPENFYLGFDRYRTELPAEAAAPVLFRQLQAIELIVRRLIEARVLKISTLDRPPLPEEAGTVRPVPGSPDGPLIARDTLGFAFSCEAGTLRPAINSFVTSEQFFILRTLRIANEKKEGPDRSAPGTLSSPAADVFAALGGDEETEGSAAPERRLEFIVGTEKLDAEDRVEIIDFADPPAAPEEAGAGS